MPAAYSDLYVEAGSNFSTTITIDDIYGNSFNLLNCVASSQIRKSYYSVNTSAVFASSINTNLSTITLLLSSANSANIFPGRYVYDTIITNNIDGSKIRILEGTVFVSPSVTR
jgi:hypothetical protein